MKTLKSMKMYMDLSEIQRLRNLCELATPGTWTNVDDKRGEKKQVWIAETAHEEHLHKGTRWNGEPYETMLHGPFRAEVANFLDGRFFGQEIHGKENARLAVAAVNALPGLLDEVEKLRAALRDVARHEGVGLDLSVGCDHCSSVAEEALR